MVIDFANDPTPYDTITRKFSSPLLVVLIDLAGVVSYFSASLPIINSGARIMYKVGHDGLLPRWTAWPHPTRLNPVAAITAICFFGLAISLIVGFAMTPLVAFGFLLISPAPHPLNAIPYVLAIWVLIGIGMLYVLRRKLA